MMKKLIALFGTFTLVTSASASVVACQNSEASDYRVEELDCAIKLLQSQGPLVIDTWNYHMLPNQLLDQLELQLGMFSNSDFHNMHAVINSQADFTAIDYDVKTQQWSPGEVNITFLDNNEHTLTIGGQTSFHFTFVTKQLKEALFSQKGFKDLLNTQSAQVDFTRNDATLGYFSNFLNQFVDGLTAQLEDWVKDKTNLPDDIKTSLTLLVAQLKAIYQLPFNAILPLVESIYTIPSCKQLLNNLWNAIPNDIKPLSADGSYYPDGKQDIENITSALTKIMQLLKMPVPDWKAEINIPYNFLGGLIGFDIKIPSWEILIGGIMPDLVHFKNAMSSTNLLASANPIYQLVKYFLAPITPPTTASPDETPVDYSQTDVDSDASIHTNLDHLLADLIGFRTKGITKAGGWSYKSGDKELVYNFVPFQFDNIHVMDWKIPLGMVNYSVLTNLLLPTLTRATDIKGQTPSDIVNYLFSKLMNAPDFTKISWLKIDMMSIQKEFVVDLSPFINSCYNLYFGEHGLNIVGQLSAQTTSGILMTQYFSNNQWHDLSDPNQIWDVNTQNIRWVLKNTQMFISADNARSSAYSEVFGGNNQMIVPLFT